MRRSASALKTSKPKLRKEILKERRRQKQMTNIAASISKYYDSLSEEKMNDDRLWGAFAESQFR